MVEAVYDILLCRRVLNHPIQDLTAAVRPDRAIAAMPPQPTRMTMPIDEVRDASAWTPEQVAADRSWEFTLTKGQQAELVAAQRQVEEAGLPNARTGAADFPLPSLRDTLDRVVHELCHGRGFAVLHGVPTAGFELPQLERIYWGLCTHMGRGVTQNSDTGLIHYVTDGRLRPRQGTRGVGAPGPVELHVDLGDTVALYCVQQAPDDPPSVVSSSMTVYNEIVRQHPEWLPRLEEGFIWDRAGEQAPGESEVSDYPVPAWTKAGGTVTCRFHPKWIRKGLARIGRSLTAAEEKIFDFIRDVADANCFAFPLHAGDIVICNNYTVFHGRAPHEPVAEEERKRMLMRVWLEIDGIRTFADEARIRFGVIRHGKLGWTAADLMAGNHGRPRQRRADGAPLI